MNISSDSSPYSVLDRELSKIIDKAAQGNVSQKEKDTITAKMEDIWKEAMVYKESGNPKEESNVMKQLQSKVEKLDAFANACLKRGRKGISHKKIQAPARAPRKHPGKESVQSKANKLVKQALQEFPPHMVSPANPPPQSAPPQ